MGDTAAASPLAGKRVVITRALEQSSELFAKLTSRAAVPILLPLVSFAPPEDFAPLDAALLRWEHFDWVLFTSANTVQAVVARNAALSRSLLQAGKSPAVAVVGPATKGEAEKAGFSVNYEAKTHLGAALAEELGERLREKNVFLPRSDRANPDLPNALRLLSAKLTEVVAYRTLPPADVDRDRAAGVVAGEADALLFFSPSAVHNFVDLVGRQKLLDLQNNVAIAAVGPVTAAALRDSGVQRIVMAADTAAAAVVDSLEEHFAANKTRSTAGAKRE